MREVSQSVLTNVGNSFKNHVVSIPKSFVSDFKFIDLLVQLLINPIFFLIKEQVLSW